MLFSGPRRMVGSAVFLYLILGPYPIAAELRICGLECDAQAGHTKGLLCKLLLRRHQDSEITAYVTTISYLVGDFSQAPPPFT